MWPISILNWSLFGQLPRGPFFTLFGWPKPWELSLIVLGRSVGGPNCGSFCLIGQNSGSYRLYKPKTMGAIAQNEPPEAKTMEAIARNESPGAKTMGAITQIGQKAQFDHFWALLPKSLPDRLRRLISTISVPCSQNRSQAASGRSFWAFLGPAPKLASRRPLQLHFHHF